MAHRADVIQVHKDFPTAGKSEMVVDPVCGKKMPHKEARSILFREDQTHYFCSRECRDTFLTPKKRFYQAA